MDYFAQILAWRYLTQKDQNNRMRTMLIVCFLGIFIGSFSLCLVLSIMNGFQIATYTQLKSINPELELHASGQELDDTSITKIITQEFPEIIAASSYDTQQALLFNKYEEEPATLVMLKGIRPETEGAVSNISKKIIDSVDHTLADLLPPHTVLIGKQLAQDVSLDVHDTVDLYFTAHKLISKKIKLSQKKVRVNGIFSTGIDELDSNLIICSFTTLHALFPESGPTHISLCLEPAANVEVLKTKLHNRFGLHAVSWQDRYPAIVSALTLEKYALFFILALITLVASMNIIALLSMHIISKRTDIALLQAMGIPLKTIKRIFILFGLIIASTACVIGILCAVIASWIIARYPLVTLPDAYAISHLPTHMELNIVILVFCVVMAVTSCALAIAIRMINTIQITQVLRFEA